VTYCALVHLVW